MSPLALEFGVALLRSIWRPAYTVRAAWLDNALLTHYRRMAIRRRVQVDQAVENALEIRRSRVRSGVAGL